MLVDLSIAQFAKQVASHDPIVPAAGSVMALSGLMGVCLLEMSIDSASGRPETEQHKDFFNVARLQLATLHDELLTYIEQDAEAYGGLLAAYKLSKSSEEAINHRLTVIQTASLAAIEVPLKIGEACLSALHIGTILLPKVKHAVLGDLKLGLLVLTTGIEGSLAAAKINLPLIKDATAVTVLQARIDELQSKST